MKKIFKLFVVFSLVAGLCGCAKLKEVKEKTAKEIYEAAVSYFDKHAKSFELQLTVNYDSYVMDADCKIDRENGLDLSQCEVDLSSFTLLDGYLYIHEGNTDFIYATPLTSYAKGSVDNELISKFADLLKINDSIDPLSMDHVELIELDKDDNNNLVIYFNYGDYPYTYALTMKIKDSFFKNGTLTIYEDDSKENVIATIDYSISNINNVGDLEEDWENCESLIGQSM